MVGQTPERIKMIVSGRVIDPALSLMTQGVKNSATVMVILLQDAGETLAWNINSTIKCIKVCHVKFLNLS